MSNTSLTTKVSAVARLDARARHRRRGARGDPADRVPRPVPLERQRLDRAEPRARREEPDPEGHLRHRDRREAALPGGDAREGRPQGRRDLRPRVPQRARRGRGHLPRPADHDRRPQRRAHGRDPDPADRQAARGGDPGHRRPRPRRLRLERRPRRHLLRDRLERRDDPRPARPERARDARSRGRRLADDPQGRRAARPEARARVRLRHAVVPAPPRRRREERRRRSRSRAPRSSRRSTGSGRRLHGPLDPRTRRRRRPRRLRRPAGVARRRELRPARDDRGRGRDGPGAAQGRARPARRRLPGPRGRPVAPHHRRGAPGGTGRADHRARRDLAERLPPSGVRRGRGRHGDLPADQGAAALRDEHRDRAAPRPRNRAERPQGRHAWSACSGRRAVRGRRSRRRTSRRRSRSRDRRCS